MKPISRNARMLVLWLAVLSLAGCATTSHVITGKPRTPIDPSQVTLYSSTPPRYEEIAVIEASSRSSFAFGDQKKMDAVIERLKKEAASLGANGVLLQRTGSEGGGGAVGAGIGTSVGGGVSIGTSIFTGGSSKTGRGLAIYVPPESR